MLTQTIDLDMVPRGEKPVVRLNQGDADFTILVKLLAREGDFKIVSGTTAKVQGTKPDGTKYTASAAINNMVVAVWGDNKMTNVPGTGTYEICLTYRGKELYTSNFSIVVEPRPI